MFDELEHIADLNNYSREEEEKKELGDITKASFALNITD